MEQSGIPNYALALSIAGLVFSAVPCCCMTWVLGLPLNCIALVLAYRAVGEITQGIASVDGMGNAKTAKILAFVGFGLNAFWLVLWVLYFFGILGFAALGLLFGQGSP